MYFNYPEKPPEAGKAFYIEEVVRCPKHTFSKSLFDSIVQSIDESVTKFKDLKIVKRVAGVFNYLNIFSEVFFIFFTKK